MYGGDMCGGVRFEARLEDNMGITDRCVEKKQMRFQVGDTIRFTDSDEVVEVMERLAQDGVYTDFLFEKDGEEGYWLVVTEEDGKA